MDDLKAVELPVEANERFINLSGIAMGILQFIAINYQKTSLCVQYFQVQSNLKCNRLFGIINFILAF